MSFIVSLGVLLLIAAIAALSAKFLLKVEMLPPFIKKITQWKAIIIMFLLAIPMMLINSLFFSAEDGYNYYVQYPKGGFSVHTDTRGITWRGFGKVSEMKDFFTISTEEGTSATIEPVDISFADKETAKQPVTYRIETPQDAEAFRNLIIEYRSQENLIRSLTPQVSEVISNTAFMYTGQAYASGEAPQFNQKIRDQLLLGSYVLETRAATGTRTSTAGDSSTTVKGKKTPVLKRRPKLDKNGLIMRIKPAYMALGIRITNIGLRKAKFTKEFSIRMKSQRTLSSDFQKSILERKTIVEQIKLEAAKGEKAKTIEQMIQEKAAVKQIIAMQTQLKKDSIAYNQSLVRKSTATIDAKTLRIKKDAEAYANQRLVSAGLTPQEKAEWKYKTDVGVAKEIAKMKVPHTVITGGGKSGGMSTEALVQLQILNGLKKK